MTTTMAAVFNVCPGRLMALNGRQKLEEDYDKADDGDDPIGTWTLPSSLL